MIAGTIKAEGEDLQGQCTYAGDGKFLNQGRINGIRFPIEAVKDRATRLARRRLAVDEESVQADVRRSMNAARPSRLSYRSI